MYSYKNNELGLFVWMLVAFISPCPEATAASEEIQVYMDEMNDPGEFGVDFHNNDVVSGSAVPSYPGAQPPAHVYRLTPEFTYGINRNFELGVYVLSSWDSHDNQSIDGEKLRLKYIAPKRSNQAYFIGANLEIGEVARRIDQNPCAAQLKGIYGYRNGRWTFAINPNISWIISGSVPVPVTLETDMKVAYKVSDDYALGLESYNGMGSANGYISPRQQAQNLYAVLDTSIGGLDLNFGVGRGFSPVSDRWTVKAIVSYSFNKK